MEQVLTDAAAPYHLFRGWVQNDQLICSGTNALRDASVTTGNYLLTFDLEEEKLVEEIELASFPFFVDGEIFYLEQGETDYTHVDLRTNQKEKLAGLELDDLWPMARAGEDFYFAKQKKEESENWTFVFVRRNPFLRGEIEVIHP
ncbi:MAG: hypothetical protein Q4G61_05545 [Tissierellia bacterium]|nr:hypothetical protein [Tissierellia bacterium]